MKTILLFLTLLPVSCATASADDCKQPLDAQTLNQLSLGWDDVELHPGDSHQFSLAILSTFAPAQEVPGCATWKVQPDGKGATISSSGLLSIDPKTPPRSRFVVTADIEQGRAQRRVGVFVYTAEDQPLVGFWREKSRTDCGPQRGTVIAQGIQELVFNARGSFSVTWVPFEVYKDYWGNYTADSSTRKLSLQIERGNYVPKNFRGAGKFKLADKNTLELTGIYFGAKQTSDHGTTAKADPSCRYTFSRLH